MKNNCSCKHNMMTVRFRAECIWDVTELLRRRDVCWSRIEITRDGYGFPDVDVTVWSAMSIEEWERRLFSVDDGHVMGETVQPIQNYTGERTDRRMRDELHLEEAQ